MARLNPESLENFVRRVEEAAGQPIALIPTTTDASVLYEGPVACTSSHGTLVLVDHTGQDEDGYDLYRSSVLLVRPGSPLARSKHRHNPPLSEHMASDNLDQIAKLLAERFVSDVVEGATPHNYARFVRKLSRTVYEEVEARADDRLSDHVQEALSDLGEMAGRLGMKHW